MRRSSLPQLQKTQNKAQPVFFRTNTLTTSLHCRTLWNADEGEEVTGGEHDVRPRSLLLAVPALLVLANVLDAGLGGGSLLASSVDSGESEGLMTLRDHNGDVGSVALRRTMLSVMSESSRSSSSWVRAFPRPPPLSSPRPQPVSLC